MQNKSGLKPLRESGLRQTELIGAPDQLYAELWVSLASLLRSYTSAHGLNRNRQATVELGEERILVRRGDEWLDLRRSGAEVNWLREDGRAGRLEFTEHGRMHSEAGEEEMDMAAEAWAQDLMRELPR